MLIFFSNLQAVNCSTSRKQQNNAIRERSQSSDGGLLLLREFYHKLGVKTLLKKHLHTTDSASFRIHKDHENLLQMLYQITGAYFQDDHADSLRNDPVLNAVVGKAALASQPTLSRFHNRMDAQRLERLEDIQRFFRRRVYSVEKPEHTQTWHLAGSVPYLRE